MSEGDPVGPDSRRWERVADSYFRAPASLGFRVGVAGPGQSESRFELFGELEEAVRALGREGHGGIQMHDPGTVDEARLASLATELPETLDLLIWVDGADGPPSERSGYLLGLFAWATEARAVLCIVPPGFGPGDLRSLEQGMDCTGLDQALAFQGAREPGDGANLRWWCGLLQGAMAREDARRRQRSTHEPQRKPALGGKA